MKRFLFTHFTLLKEFVKVTFHSYLLTYLVQWWWGCWLLLWWKPVGLTPHEVDCFQERTCPCLAGWNLHGNIHRCWWLPTTDDIMPYVAVIKALWMHRSEAYSNMLPQSIFLLWGTYLFSKRKYRSTRKMELIWWLSIRYNIFKPFLVTFKSFVVNQYYTMLSQFSFIHERCLHP